jgi:hypothetical protein
MCCWRGLPLDPWPTPAGPDPLALEAERQLPHIHQAAGAVAQLLAMAQQEPPLLALHLLGHPAPEVAATLLHALLRLARGVASADAGRELAGAPAADALSAQLQALHHTAVACNALLQQLSTDEAHQVCGGGASGPALLHVHVHALACG